MPKRPRSSAKSSGTKLSECTGGNSADCHHDKHPRGKTTFNCRRCKQYMGCSLCALGPKELVCLNCKDWALDIGEKVHGPIVEHGEVRPLFLKAIATEAKT